MCQNTPEHQAFTSPNAQITAQTPDTERQELAQIITAWPTLSAPLRNGNFDNCTIKQDRRKPIMAVPTQKAQARAYLRAQT